MLWEKELFISISRNFGPSFWFVGGIPIPCLLGGGGEALPNRMIYTFHMGLFMLMCGFFSHHALSMPFWPFLKKKALQLLVPTVAFVGLNLLSTWVVAGSCPIGFIRNEAVGGMWFLRTLFLCYLFVWMVLRLPGVLWLKIIGSIALALLMPHGYYLQFNYMLIFFWTGYMVKGCYGELKKHCFLAFLVSFVIFLVVPWQRPEALTYNVLFHHPLQLSMQLLGGFSGSILSISLMMLICKHFPGKWKDRLAVVGHYTLAIYGLQGVLLQYIVENIFSISASVCPIGLQQYVIAPAIGAVTVAVCYVAAKLMDGNRVTALLFLGKAKGNL